MLSDDQQVAVNNVIRLANLAGMKRVRLFVCQQPSYHGMETAETLEASLNKTREELLKEVTAIVQGDLNA